MRGDGVDVDVGEAFEGGGAEEGLLMEEGGLGGAEGEVFETGVGGRR